MNVLTNPVCVHTGLRYLLLHEYREEKNHKHTEDRLFKFTTTNWNWVPSRAGLLGRQSQRMLNMDGDSRLIFFSVQGMCIGPSRVVLSLARKFLLVIYHITSERPWRPNQLNGTASNPFNSPNKEGALFFSVGVWCCCGALSSRLVLYHTTPESRNLEEYTRS